MSNYRGTSGDVPVEKRTWYGYVWYLVRRTSRRVFRGPLALILAVLVWAARGARAIPEHGRFFVVGVPIVAVASTTYYYCSWHDVPVTVKDTSWTYTTKLHEKTMRRSSAWSNQMHDNAFDVTCERKLRRTYDCHCFTTTTGDVTIEHCSTCKDYDSWCTYNWWDWPVVREEFTTGDCGVDPFWPGLKADKSGNERLTQIKKFRVKFVGEFEDELLEWNLPVETLARCAAFQKIVGGKWKLSVTRSGKAEIASGP